MNMMSVKQALCHHEIEILDHERHECISNMEKHRVTLSEIYSRFQDIIHSVPVDHQQKMTNITTEIMRSLSYGNTLRKEYQEIQSRHMELELEVVRQESRMK
jgi:hypothetical protein